MQLQEIFDKYGDVKLKFDNYYKWRFHYKGEASDGNIITATLGTGDSGQEIYKSDVEADQPKTLNEKEFDSVRIDTKSGQCIAQEGLSIYR